ncbi:MAG: DUF58 domain-containing protein [Muribaculaceae bacterium]|nr:DUF58 domain-containing protein [Roseburia sp.]MCM1430861.1 DUF58 domain-containing protein [Muribaculaceae bacterium]MCM1492840.1 DUF58 domain-containing protein [Muribaculaceae bacterium]
MGILIKNWICYTLLTVAALLFTIYYRQSFFLVLLLLLFFLPAISYFLCRYGFAHTNVALSSKVFLADKPATLPLCVAIANDSVLPLSHLEITLSISSFFYPKEQREKLILPAYARKTTTNSFPISYTKSGCYRAKLLQLSTYDFLRLFRFSRTADTETEVVIMPCANGETGRHSVIYAEGFDEFEETSAKGNVSSNVTDVREYRPGDRLQKIHWKLTARTDDLMVKENEATASNRFVVLTELYQPHPANAGTDDRSLDILDTALDYTFMLGKELLQAGECFFLTFYSIKRADFSSFFIRSLEEFYDALTQLFYESSYQTEDLGREIYGKTHPNQGTLLHVTHRGVKDVVF